nr:hypothetical protein [uncultured Dyadobacter sp.]
MPGKSVFQLKEDSSQTVSVALEEVLEVVPDADFRFSLLILHDGQKIFVCGTKEEVYQNFD